MSENMDTLLRSVDWLKQMVEKTSSHEGGNIKLLEIAKSIQLEILSEIPKSIISGHPTTGLNALSSSLDILINIIEGRIKREGKKREIDAIVESSKLGISIDEWNYRETLYNAFWDGLISVEEYVNLSLKNSQASSFQHTASDFNRGREVNTNSDLIDPINKSSFIDLLESNQKQELIKCLTINYKESKPEIIYRVVVALIELGCLKPSVLHNITMLHKMLKTSPLNFNGTRQALSDYHMKYRFDIKRESEYLTILSTLKRFQSTLD